MIGKKTLALAAAAAVALAAAGGALAAGNEKNESFSRAKKLLEQKVYFDHRVTFYCLAEFDERKNIALPAGFTTPEHAKRARRVEWEHVVPAENFGRFFREWRDGDFKCIREDGTAFRGRRCAEKASRPYRLMQSDLYNLYPAIGAVNAIRSNHNFEILPEGTPSTFGVCPMKVVRNRVEPPEYTRGAIARTTLYMADAYADVYRLSAKQRAMMESWNEKFPPDAWECKRAKRIRAIQGNENRFVTEACRRAGL